MRFITAASLFDGHDVAINLFRRLLVQHGNEVIHLGHNRSVFEIIRAAIQEDVHAIAVSSYQGGHNEFFAYLLDALKAEGAERIAVFGGGGGVITPTEVANLESLGVDKIYTPLDGQRLGLKKIVTQMMELTTRRNQEGRKWHIQPSPMMAFSRSLTEWMIHTAAVQKEAVSIPVIGFTGTGGAGKSSVIDELLLRYRMDFPDARVLVLSCDPVKKKTNGALLGDRIRMNAIYEGQIFFRSIAVPEEHNGVHPGISSILQKLVQEKRPMDLVVVESAGIGQADTEITKYVHRCVYVMTSEFGAETQLEKISMLDYADLVILNKMDRQGAEDALHQVRKTLRRQRELSEADLDRKLCGAVAARFQDPLTHQAYVRFLHLVSGVRDEIKLSPLVSRYFEKLTSLSAESQPLIPRHRVQYLAEIAQAIRTYHSNQKTMAEKLKNVEALETLHRQHPESMEIARWYTEAKSLVPPEVWTTLDLCRTASAQFQSAEMTYTVRGQSVVQKACSTSLSGLSIPKVAVCRWDSTAALYTFCSKENYPGYFPFAAGIYPFKRTEEFPKRMFSGEGGPARTNARFHFLCRHEKAKRLSTAFDSVTLYGADPDERPDIFGKIGESGVSIATLDDMKALYKGFDLCDPQTSVSMTINGPAPMILAFFFNAAIDQQTDRFRESEKRDPTPEEYETIRRHVLRTVRGTVQADILKEDQAQNTCIFSTPFALRMMADIQQFFIEHNVRNFYSVSVSGYHIAEAGAAPISQLAFTLANGFTYVELYKARGMPVSAFAPNLSFFFSNGLDPEYTVIGRVARRIWAIAMKMHYGADERSQKLKYHIQTSGRSLHSQEITFNDIRTTLQALLAIADNCNSLHTNAFDEAITTPTEASVRQAMAIQLITMQELGLTKNENPWQGSFFLEWLTDAVEDAVLAEFDRISDRGGVLAAMEYQYQRNRIQTESYTYEHMKHEGALPIVGVNTFVSEKPHDQGLPTIPLTRSSAEEKQDQITRLKNFQSRNQKAAAGAMERLRRAALDPKANLFVVLLDVSRVLSLGQMSDVLYACGGKYRRNM